MKIQEILSEAFDPYRLHSLSNPVDSEVTPVTELNKLAEIIKQNCSETLAAYAKTTNRIVRGLNHEGFTGPLGRGAIITRIRHDRKPVQMDQEGHELLTDIYNAAGIRAHRANSIFCTTKINTAADWGQPYIIYPKDGWTGSYCSKIIKDYAFYTVRSIAGDANYNIDHGIKSRDEAVKEAAKELLANGFVEFEGAAGLLTVLKKQASDFLITGDSYIALTPEISKKVESIISSAGPA